jgi:hypothetical protein
MQKKSSSFAALGGLVYSTDSGRHCPDCNQPVDACTCKQNQLPDGEGDHVELLLSELTARGFKAKKSGG